MYKLHKLALDFTSLYIIGLSTAHLNFIPISVVLFLRRWQIFICKRGTFEPFHIQMPKTT